MKSFHFRLGQALRWRNTQLEVEKAKVSAAARQVRELRGEIERRQAELLDGAASLPQTGVTGSTLALWGAFTENSRRRIHSLETSVGKAEQVLRAQMELLTEANRRVRLLENLRDGDLARWKADLDRELENFAGESSLVRLQLRRRAGA